MNEIITEQLRKHKKELSDKYSIKEIGIFGSYARDEEKPDSDIDILIEFDQGKTPGFFKFLDIEDDLEKILKEG